MMHNDVHNIWLSDAFVHHLNADPVFSEVWTLSVELCFIFFN